MSSDLPPTPDQAKYTSQEMVDELKRVDALLDCRLDRITYEETDHRISVAAITRRFGRWSKALKVAGLPLAHQFGPSGELDREDVRRLYVDEGLSAPKVAERLGVSKPTVYNQLDHLGIDTRDFSDYDHKQLSFDECYEKDANGDGCWLWTAGGSERYGHWWEDGRSRPAHRVAYERFVGPVSDELHVHHTCGNGFCVNPDHFQPMDPSEHLRMHAPKRQRYCERGHPLFGENLSVYGKDNQRRCKACHRRREWERRRGLR